MRKSILLTESSQAIRSLVQKAMEREGYDVVATSNTSEAINAMNDHAFHMVISDLNLQEADGLNFVKSVRGSQKSRFIPVLMLSSETGNEIRTTAKRAGATGWINLSDLSEKLVPTVKKVLR